MKRLIGLPLCIALLGLGVACDSSKKEDKKADKDKAADKGKAGADKAAADDAKAKEEPKPEPAKPVKLTEASLEDVGMEAKLQAPEGAKIAEEFGAYTVKAGDSFQLEIHTGAADLGARKTEIEGNTVNKLKKFHKESDTELVYETEVMSKAEFHFVANKEVDGAKYHCEDTKGRAYTQAEIDAMLAACASLAAI